MRPGHYSATFTKVGRAALALALLVRAIPLAIGETNPPRSYSVYKVTGYARLVPTYAAATLKDNSEVVAWLAPAEAAQKERLNAEPPHYRIVQHHKMFEPRFLVVPAGSIVEFPNHDPWFHDVFSDSRTRRFDLGLYEAGAEKTVRFDRPGTWYLFCSIHPEMTAIVLAVNSPYFGVSDRTGHISIENVPPGKYLLHVRYENAAPQALEALRRVITVGEESRRLSMISFCAVHSNSDSWQQ